MERCEIEKGLKRLGTTILDAPDRGEWGDRKYRGNCSGWVHASLISKYRPRKMAELFAGGGTGYDVARDMNIPYVGADLNPVPVRPGILQTDAVNDDVPEEFCDADLLFAHPPYGKEIGIPYAGSMYPDPTGELSKRDLGQMEWKPFMEATNEWVMKYYSALPKGAYLCILMGDVRRKGKFYSMFSDIVKPGDLEQILIKTQHNTCSDGRSYSGSGFYPIVHEYLLVCRKPDEYMICYRLPQGYSKDVRDAKSSTWRDVVTASLEHLGGKASLSEIYGEIDGHEKTRRNSNWQAKIRQTLQMSRLFITPERGVWELAA